MNPRFVPLAVPLATPLAVTLEPPLPEPASAGRTGGYLAIEGRARVRRVPSRGGLLRRRWTITATKFLLPAAALLLLSSIALWPELEGASDRARVVMRGFSGGVEGARVSNARYNGMDQRGRPFTVTATTASQRDPDRVDFTLPVGDMTLENGTWLNLKAKRGVFTRRTEQLDLSQDVVLYRDDGTTLTTASATVEVKAGVASSAEPTHAEGPFGVLDAAGFTTLDKGAAIQFWGPVRVELNAVTR